MTVTRGGRDSGLRFRDLDGDGTLRGDRRRPALRSPRRVPLVRIARSDWARLPFDPPAGAWITGRDGVDAGLRFVDIDEDGHDDVVFSNDDALRPLPVRLA